MLHQSTQFSEQQIKIMSNLVSPKPPKTDIKKVAILFSGGPAPTANSVIGSAALCFSRAGIEVYGMKNGYVHLANYQEGSKLEEGIHYIRLDKKIEEGLRTSRGIIIGTARANPGKLLKNPLDLKDPQKVTPLQTVYKALSSLDIDALISIGGDDTLTTAAKFKLVMDSLPDNQKRIKIIHLPKTIDNDYKGIDFTFGYFTAVEMLAHEIRNLLADSEATETGYISQVMGRKAAWLAYGASIAGEASLVIGLEDIHQNWYATEPTVDPETGSVMTGEDGNPVLRQIFDVQKIVDRCVDVIQARETEGKTAFVAVVSEGLAEYLPLSEIKMCCSDDEYKSLKPDSFGHFPVSQLKYSSRLGRLIAEEYKKRTGKSKKMVGLQFGYEIRCNQPTAYDVVLGSQIGVGGYKALAELDKNGVMISVGNTMNISYPAFEELIDMNRLRAYERPISVGSDIHQLARYLEGWVKE
ncbi:MAG: 6-phosphofructokinase [Planctomycetaceae bacterium]|jgi:6-phosphofructokinase 1|nr:6-phosphofructokinase [Planctomycetaceae bacterium]